jgi:uncharacterized Rmd1/YagE family protein
VRAVLLGERIDFKGLESTEKLAVSPLTIPLRGGGIAVVFRYGAVVLFDVAPMEEEDLLRQLQPRIGQPFDSIETERVNVCVRPEREDDFEGNTIYLKDHSVERFQLIADVLSKSVVLAQYEQKLQESFDRVEPIAVSLERGDGSLAPMRNLLRHIGSALLTEHKMVGRAELVDKPDVLWERPDLERLYLRVRDEFEIRERYSALDRKLALLAKTAETVLDISVNKRMLRVEWYIVALIVLEICLTLYQMASDAVR